MSAFDMNNTTDNALKMDVYAERLGGNGKLGYAKRRERGIRIIGKKNKIG